MKLKFLFALLVFQFGFAQHHRSCGRDQQMEQIMSDPVKKQAYLEIQNKIQFELQKMSASKKADSEYDVVHIPVAIHFPLETAANEQKKACLKSLAQSQINVLNADYNAANADISNWADDAANYPMVTAVGNLKMQFDLATQNHPAGSGIAEGTVAVTFGTAFLNTSNPLPDPNWAGYLNIVVMEVPEGNLGFTPHIGISPSAGAACFITTYAFGTGAGCAGYTPEFYCNLGRATTHEVGHYFQLDHPFTGECNAGDCTATGDFVCDTPAIAEASYSDFKTNACPYLKPTGCVSGEYALSMNYMDYADDKCMYMFTKGQENRARAWYNTIASQFKTDVFLANDTFLQNKFSVYPNPSKGSFTIALKDFTNSYAIEVFDVTGNVVYENNFSRSSGLVQVVNLPNVTNGVYFVNIKSDQGTVTKKLIVQ